SPALALPDHESRSFMRPEALDRVKVIFALFDVNGNGHLEADDFELMATQVVQNAPDSGAAEKNSMVNAFHNYWARLEAERDDDNDGKVSYDEFVDCVLSPERFDTTVAEFATALAALGDPDGDGLIERPVFVALMTAIGFDLANIEALFDAFGP